MKAIIPILCCAALSTGVALAADPSNKSSPPDKKTYSRPAKPSDGAANRGNQGGWSPHLNIDVVDTILNNTSPTLGTGPGSETSIAINPANKKEIVITAFEFNLSWASGSASLFHSTDGGKTWTEPRSINQPPGGLGLDGCPCDQAVDFSRTGLLSGTFLTEQAIYSSSTSDAENGPFNWFEQTPGVAQTTNTVHPDPDQPWLLVNAAPKDPYGIELVAFGDSKKKAKELVYVAYDDFSTNPVTMRVAVAAEGASPEFTVDNSDGVSAGNINPGHRLAKDENSGAIYGLFQQSPATNPDGSKNINYILNRSTDGGATWTLNGSTTGIVVANANSDQINPKFCTVNALLGGVDHASVAPDGSLYYVYGNKDAATGNNRLAIRHLTDNGTGGLTIGPETFVTGQVQAAIPQVAVANDGTVGVFYYTCDDPADPSGFPKLSAHFALSGDEGGTWQDNVLQTFLSPSADNGDPRQRVLGDYMQTKAAPKGKEFLGSFSGNGAAVGGPVSEIHPMFFRVGNGP